jgi:hypothetical protein
MGSREEQMGGGLALRRYYMNGRFQMHGAKNWILLKEMNANRFFWDSHWLEIWANHLFLSMGSNGRIVAMDSGQMWAHSAPFLRGIEPKKTGAQHTAHKC